MKYLIVLILCSLATSKMSLQSAFGKKSVKNTADAFCFNAISFLFTAIVFINEIFDCPWQVWVYAALGAICAVIYQMTYTKALAMGNVSLTVLIVNLSLVINVLVSYLFYGDGLSPVRLTGILLTIVTFFLCIELKDGANKSEKNWLFFTLLAMISCALGCIVQKALGESSFRSFNRAYTSASYLVAAVMAYLLYLVLKAKGENKTFRIGKGVVLYSMLIGFILAAYVVLNVYALSVVEGTFLFPAYAGGAIIFSTLSGVILFKDKLNLKQILSVVVGIVAAILMNF